MFPPVTHFGCVSKHLDGVEPSSIIELGELTYRTKPVVSLPLPGKANPVPSMFFHDAALAFATKSYTSITGGGNAITVTLTCAVLVFDPQVAVSV